MQSLRRFWKRVIADFRARRNLDVYILSGFTAFLIFVSLIGEVPESLKSIALFGSLSLLVLNIATPRTSAGNLDDYLNDRSKLGSFSDRIRGTRKLWIYAPSAANILRTENAEAIRKEILAYPDGEFRVIIQDPDATHAMAILKKQLDESIDYQVQHLPDEIQHTLRQLELIKSWKVQGRFEYKLLEYGPGFSLVAVDAHKNNGVVIVETHGFHNESTDARMNIEIVKIDSERWFTYWTSQFDHMWQAAKAPNQANP
jgi:hypothetical protein